MGAYTPVAQRWPRCSLTFSVVSMLILRKSFQKYSEMSKWIGDVHAGGSEQNAESCCSQERCSEVRNSFSLPSGHCPGHAFSCRNSQCVTKVNPECDDKVDCSDGSDEAHCGQSARLAWSWAVSPSQGRLLFVLSGPLCTATPSVGP